MANYLDIEEQKYQEDVRAVKKWWTDSRWRYTKRPFTAEQIVQKRGTIRIDYPSNTQAKKLWKLMEERFAVRLHSPGPVWPFSMLTSVPCRLKPLRPPTVASSPPCSPR